MKYFLMGSDKSYRDLGIRHENEKYWRSGEDIDDVELEKLPKLQQKTINAFLYGEVVIEINEDGKINFTLIK